MYGSQAILWHRQLWESTYNLQALLESEASWIHSVKHLQGPALGQVLLCLETVSLKLAAQGGLG